MPAAPADLRIEARWIAPMTCAKHGPRGSFAAGARRPNPRYSAERAALPSAMSATVVLSRKSHLLMPGMINVQSDAATLLYRAANGEAARMHGLAGADFARDGTLAAIATMLKSGITCFCDRSTSRRNGQNGQRTGHARHDRLARHRLPTPWAQRRRRIAHAGAEAARRLQRRIPDLDRALRRSAPDQMSDATFARLATLADEFDAGS